MKLLAILVFAFTLISCNKSKVIGPEILGYDFYPIEIGQYRIYDVEEIQYKLVGFDTSFYQLRETIFDSISTTDQIVYLIRRDKRASESDQWESDSVWTATATTNYLAISENNVPFVKLTFPVELGKEWNGNVLNSKSEITYYYQFVTEGIIDSVNQDARCFRSACKK